MKLIALILAVMITAPHVVSGAGYLFGDELILVDGNLGAEEQDERESKDTDQKNTDFSINEDSIYKSNSIRIEQLNAYLEEGALLSQERTKDISPPPED